MNIYYDKDANLDVIKNLNIAIIGFGSQGHAHALNLQDSGANVTVGLRAGSASINKAKTMGLDVKDIEDAAKDADVVMTLRIQYERFEKELNLDLETYKSEYQLSSEKLENAKGDAIIMHPGPVNYIEITEAVYDSENSVIRQQIANGVAIRMAVLSRFLGS